MTRNGALIHDAASPRAGIRNANWKGGRTMASSGYVLIKCADHPDADVRGYVYEHRLVATSHLGRLLRDGEQVHHRNGDKADNRWENLEVLSAAEHAARHRKRTDLRHPGEGNPDVECECGCGKTFARYDRTNRPRRFLPGHNVQPRRREFPT